jgi:DNA-binding FadR family transcriptional regulator
MSELKSQRLVVAGSTTPAPEARPLRAILVQCAMAKNLSRSATLARELLALIARRELKPGDPIDLQALGQKHQVSRTVVREALADLGGKGLVIARPKVGTTVAAANGWNLIDPVFVSVAIAQTGSASMMGEALELYHATSPALAGNAARAATRSQQSSILAALRALADAVGQADRHAHNQADQALHEALAEACANRLLRSVDRALDPVRHQLRQRLHASQLPAGSAAGPVLRRALSIQSALCLAIARRDEAQASACMREFTQVMASIPPPGPVAIAASINATPPAPQASARPLQIDISSDAEWPDTAMLVPSSELDVLHNSIRNAHP